MSITIRPALDSELPKIFSLRYQVFVAEPGPWNSSTNDWTHGECSIPDKPGVETLNLVAISEGQIVGGRAILRTGSTILEERAEWGLDELEKKFGYQIQAPNQLGELRRLFVLPQWRRQGIGSKLTTAGENLLRYRGVDVVFGAIKVGNDASAQLRLPLGWVLCGGVRGDVYNFDYFAKNLRPPV